MKNSNSEQNPASKVKYFKGGPYQVEGPCIIIDNDGNEVVKEGKIFLCRCGHSSNKPFCDGSHKKYNFDK